MKVSVPEDLTEEQKREDDEQRRWEEQLLSQGPTITDLGEDSDAVDPEEEVETQTYEEFKAEMETKPTQPPPSKRKIMFIIFFF